MSKEELSNDDKLVLEVKKRYKNMLEQGVDPYEWAYAWRSEINRGGFKAVDFLMDEIVETGKCVGCAACVTICPTDVFDYKDEHPVDTRKDACVFCELCADVCPVLRPLDKDLQTLLGFKQPVKDEGFGPYNYAVIARSKNKEFLERGQDGGVTSEMLVHLLENGIINGAVLGDVEPENPPLYNDMNVADYLDFVADIKRVPSKEKKKRLMYVMERCGITGVSKRIIAHLSKGYKQRVGIAQALINNPTVLVLDEPTNGLDPVQIIEIRELIKSLSGERTVILSTHILPEVTMICSRVIIINEGRIALEESLDSLSLNLRGTHNLFLKVRQDSEEVKEKIESIENIARVNSGAPGEYVISLANGADVRDELTKTAVSEDWGLLELRPLTHTLEEVFLKVISSEG